MKKKSAFVLAAVLVCILSLSACGNDTQVQTSVYSFRGENEFFAISNGSIVLSDTEEVFDGGKFHVIQTDIFDNITSYSATFYTMKDGVQRTLMSNSIVDQTGGSIHIEGDLGKMSGDGFIIDSKNTNIDELKKSLWFELKTTDLDGKESTYQLQLTLNEQPST